MILILLALLLVVAAVAGTRGRATGPGARRRALMVLAGVVALGVLVWVVVIAVQASGA